MQVLRLHVALLGHPRFTLTRHESWWILELLSRDLWINVGHHSKWLAVRNHVQVLSRLDVEEGSIIERRPDIGQETSRLIKVDLVDQLQGMPTSLIETR